MLRDIEINGFIVNCDVEHEEFLHEFIQWLESKGWGFTGSTKVVSDYEEEDEEEGEWALFLFIQVVIYKY